MLYAKGMVNSVVRIGNFFFRNTADLVEGVPSSPQVMFAAKGRICLEASSKRSAALPRAIASDRPRPRPSFYLSGEAHDDRK
jgi:hypothetical protein